MQPLGIGMSRKHNYHHLTPADIDRIIEMAWEDRTPFDAIKAQFGLCEQEVIALMRRELKSNSWKLWRERAKKISQKHAKKRPENINRFKCSLQRIITHNKITKSVKGKSYKPKASNSARITYRCAEGISLIANTPQAKGDL